MFCFCCHGDVRVTCILLCPWAWVSQDPSIQPRSSRSSRREKRRRGKREEGRSEVEKEKVHTQKEETRVEAGVLVFVVSESCTCLRTRLRPLMLVERKLVICRGFWGFSVSLSVFVFLSLCLLSARPFRQNLLHCS